MHNPSPSMTSNYAADPHILAHALTDHEYDPVTIHMIGDATQTAPVLRGTVIGKITSGPDAGLYAVYDPAATDGSEVAIGLLHGTIPADGLYAIDPNGALIATTVIESLFIGGDFIKANLTGLDAAAEAALGGTTDNEIFSFGH